VMRSVYALQGSKTIIIVAHRLSTVESCQRVYRLEAGRLLGDRQSIRIAYVGEQNGEPLPPERLGSGS
jgi:ATP-binding cassette, subfamily B, bacterial PglK